jgi:hypothetical protein
MYPASMKRYLHCTAKQQKDNPLIVFIHGIGELGTGLSRLNCCGLPYHIKGGTFPAKFLVNGVYYSFIVILTTIPCTPKRRSNTICS